MQFNLLYVLQIRLFYLICLYTVVQEDVDRYSRLEQKWQKEFRCRTYHSQTSQ
jgi:hypothetical protein